MTNQEKKKQKEKYQALYNELKEYYGDKLVNHIHHPIQFKNQIKLYNYIQSKKTNTDLEIVDDK